MEPEQGPEGIESQKEVPSGAELEQPARTEPESTEQTPEQLEQRIRDLEQFIGELMQLTSDAVESANKPVWDRHTVDEEFASFGLKAGELLGTEAREKIESIHLKWCLK